MRMASDKGHPDYPHHNPGLVFSAQVYLNGKKLNHCVFADEQKGVAEVFKTYASGRLVVIKGDLETKILIGDVKIKFDQ